MMQEISLNVLDVAQNSVSAKATLIQILVEETQDKRLIITIEDNGCGMSEEQVKSVIDPFYTTRTTRKVGLGIPFFKMGAEMTGGSFSIQSKVGEGTVVTAIYHTDHIDCMPLGDMGETIVSLVSCNPQIDFLYTRRYLGDEFVMDTREFKKILGDVPLNEPEVISYLREFLSENTKELLEGKNQ